MINNSDFVKDFFLDVPKIINKINFNNIEIAIKLISKTKKNNGRVFFVGLGGSSANCSHAVNDFRKLCNIEAYTPTDNVSELTAIANDEGFEKIFTNYFYNCNIKSKDLVIILSVGGGSSLKKVSLPIIKLFKILKAKNVKTFSILGKQDGYAGKNSDHSIIIPEVSKDLITPFSESFQSLILHCIVSHPLLKVNKTKW